MDRIMRSKRGCFALVILALLAALALFGPLLSGQTYYEIDLAGKNASPSAAHWFGTDELGRDFFTRCCLGIRISLFVGVSAALLDLFIGIWYGAIAAAIGGAVEELMMRAVDIIETIPYLLLVALLIVVFGSGLFSIILALIATSWIPMARIVRAEVLSLREADYLLASKTMGASLWHQLKYHLIPGASGPIIATMTLTVPLAIFTEAILSFLGLGVRIPIASLGTLASDGISAMRFYPLRLFLPALFISSIILSFNLLSDLISNRRSNAPL